MAGRRPEKRNHVVAQIRKEIVEGRLKPGERLETRRALEKRFNAGPAAITTAIRILEHQGFLHTEARKGVFVSERSPHLNRIGVVFPERLRIEDPATSLFDHAVRTQSIALQSSVAHEVDFYCLNKPLGPGDSPDMMRLKEDFELQRLAGLIFATPPYRLLGTEILNKPDFPRVIIGLPSLRSKHLPYAGFIWGDRSAFYQRAASLIKRNGLKNVAVLELARDSDVVIIEDLETALAKNNLHSQSSWQLTVSPHTPACARNITNLLVGRNQSPRPDALIIADDNLTPHALRGMKDAGLSLPDDLMVISHWNAPNPTPKINGVTWLGFDVREMLDVCFSMLDSIDSYDEVQDTLIAPRLLLDLPQSDQDLPVNNHMASPYVHMLDL